MKRKWFAGTLGAFALVAGSAWSGINAAQAVSFEPPADNAAPRETTGGASRGNFFAPPADNAAPRETTGGASRGNFFAPPADNAAPRESTGGASRGDFFAPPADNASPRETVGGASRSEDAFDAESESVKTSGPSRDTRSNIYGATSFETGPSAPSMLAVMPETFFGTTVEARPTILVYVPRSTAQEAVFSLKNEAKDTVYEMSLEVPTAGGVVAIEMPTSAPALAVEENYQWYVAIKMEGELTPSSPFVDGWVKRIEPSAELSQVLNQSDAITKVEALGKNGVWYDTAARLAELAEDRSDSEMANHWYELLQSVGLDGIASAPIVM